MKKKDSSDKIIYLKNKMKGIDTVSPDSIMIDYFQDLDSNQILNNAKSIISEVERDELLIVKRHVSGKLLEDIHKNCYNFAVDMLIFSVLFLFIQYVLFKGEEITIWWALSTLVFLCMFIIRIIRIYKKHKIWINLINKELKQRSRT